MNPLSPNSIAYNGIILSVQMWRDSPMFTRAISGGSMSGGYFHLCTCMHCYSISELVSFLEKQRHGSSTTKWMFWLQAHRQI